VHLAQLKGNAAPLLVICSSEEGGRAQWTLGILCSALCTCCRGLLFVEVQAGSFLAVRLEVGSFHDVKVGRVAYAGQRDLVGCED